MTANTTTRLHAVSVAKDKSVPRTIYSEDSNKLQRVARPLRNVKHIPVKAQVFYSKDGPTEFSYEKKIRTPIPKDKIVVQVKHVGLNPVDLKIRNGYRNAVYGQVGLGREYSGVVTHVGSDIQFAWHEGDEVFGIYYHPHLGNGALQSSILVDPKVDPILLRPDTISEIDASASLYCLGTAFNILDRLQRDKFLNSDSNILINGGTSSVGMFAIQLLKRHYKVSKKIVIVTSSNGPEILKKNFSDFANEMFFINYLTCRGKASKPLKKMLDEKKIEDYTNSNEETFLEYDQGKFDIVLDFVGGYDILLYSSTLIHGKGCYVTTVGDYVSNYNTDIFNSWNNPSANARKLFGSVIWSYTYLSYNFDPTVKSASKNDWINKCGQFLEDGTVKCVVDKVYDWKDTVKACDYIRTQRAQGKIVLKVEIF